MNPQEIADWICDNIAERADVIISYLETTNSVTISEVQKDLIRIGINAGTVATLEFLTEKGMINAQR